MGRKAWIYQYMVDSKTRKIYAVSITDEKSGDASEFKKLLSEALHNIENSVMLLYLQINYWLVLMIPYDSNDNFEQCKKM